MSILPLYPPAAIPVAVLSITIFRALSRAFGTRRATILENNIVQTTGSAGESIAFGVGATMPALMILGSVGSHCPSSGAAADGTASPISRASAVSTDTAILT